METDDTQREAFAATATAPGGTGSSPTASSDGAERGEGAEFTAGAVSDPGARGRDAGTRGRTGAELRAGDGIGRYTITRVLGAGGMGIVYAAYDPDLDRTVALKLLRRHAAEGSASSEQRARLLREARAIARMSHPNVIAVYEVGTVDDTDFVAMEMVDGHNLAEWLTEGHHWREVLRVMRRAGRGLVAAHAAGLVHRDFKPANVLLGKDGRVRVTDFGLARAMSPATAPVRERVADGADEAPDHVALAETSASEGSLTRTGAVVGTPAYMAPEQHEGKATDARTDQFSFCASLYEALYRERPFAGETVSALREATLAGRVGAAPRGTDVPAWLRRAIMRGLSAAPDKRYESMAVLLAELGRDPAVRRKRIVAGVLLAGVVAGAVGFGLTRGGGGSAPDPCADAAAQLGDAWDATVRARVASAFTKVGDTAVRERFTTMLDDYAASWTRVYTGSCRATRVRRERSEEQFHATMGCLLERKRELSSLAGVFARPAEGAEGRALQAAQSLSSVAVCADHKALQRRVKLPANEAMRKRVNAVRDELAQIKALQEAGLFTDAVTRAAKVVTGIRDVGYQPLTAEALYRLGRLMYFIDRPADARTLLDEVVLLADATSYDEMRARALVSLTQVSAIYSSNGDATRQVARTARAAIKRFGGELDLDARLANALGMMLMAEDDYPAALVQFEAAHDFYERGRGEGHLRAARPLRMIAQVHVLENRAKPALRFARRALATLSLLGPDHHRVATARELLASALRLSHRYDEARDEETLAERFWRSPRGVAHLRAAGIMREPSPEVRSVSGRVVDADGAPVANAEVAAAALLTGDGKYMVAGFDHKAAVRFGLVRAVTGSDGSFTLPRVEKGGLLVVAEAGDLGRSAVSTLASSGPVKDMTLTLVPFGRVEGNVVLPPDGPANLGVLASAVGVRGGLQTRQSVGVALGSDGHFAIERLPAGKYMLQFGHGGRVGLSFRTEPITVVAGKTARATLRYESTGVATEIAVRDTGGRPVQSAQVFLFDEKVSAADGLALNRALVAAASAGTIHMGVVRERRTPTPPTADPLAGPLASAPRDKIVRFDSVRPGMRSLCVVPLGGDLKDPAFARQVAANAATLAVVCRRVSVSATPSVQQIQVQVPLMKPLPLVD